jgi:predicted nuclease of predicted toxin-antitoxin system
LRFLADMGVSARVVEWLAGAGHDAVHLAHLHLQRLPNGEIFDLAARDDRIVLTFDLDFGEIVVGNRQSRAPVILFRLNNARAESVIARLAAVLKESAAALEEGSLIVVEDGRHRIRRFSIYPPISDHDDSDSTN